MITFKNFAGMASVSAVALALGATAASAQVTTVGTNFVGVIETVTDEDVVTGTSATTTVGSIDEEPFTSVTTTVQNQTLTTTGSDTVFLPNLVSVGGISYDGTVSVSGEGSQAQTVTAVRTDVYDPGLPPVLVDTDTVVGAPVNVGAATVTAVSVEGEVGNVIESFGATINSSGTPNAAGNVVVTGNSYIATTSGLPETGGAAGMVFEQRVGTATFNPSSGDVTVTMPVAPTSRTAITSAGLTTTGGVTAATVSAGSVTATSVTATSISTNGLNMNGARITNVGNGTASSDAANVGQLNTAVSTINSSISSLDSRLTGRINEVSREAEAGTAVAIAMGGGFFLPNKKINMSVNYGNYEGLSAISGSLGVLVSDNFALNAGVATSLNSGVGGTGFRVGGTVGF